MNIKLVVGCRITGVGYAVVLRLTGWMAGCGVQAGAVVSRNNLAPFELMNDRRSAPPARYDKKTRPPLSLIHI